MKRLVDSAHFFFPLWFFFQDSNDLACARESESVVEFLPAGYSAGGLVCLHEQQMAYSLGLLGNW